MFKRRLNLVQEIPFQAERVSEPSGEDGVVKTPRIESRTCGLHRPL